MTVTELEVAKCVAAPTKPESDALFQRIGSVYVRDGADALITKNYHGVHVDWAKVVAAPEQVHKFGGWRRPLDAHWVAWEVEREGLRLGVVTNGDISDKFEHYFLHLMLSVASMPMVPKSRTDDDVVEEIANLFETQLKNTSPGDQWDVGRDYFEGVVRHFVERGLPVEAVLPAFPCKSLNRDKVAGGLPDKGEKLALDRLVQFVKSVRQVYAPGMKIWIVSDGHVFSDCIGVDDDEVDVYSEALKDLYREMDESDGLGFRSLVDLFDPDDFDVSLVNDVVLPHHLKTKLVDKLELCRKILMKLCDLDCGELQRDIDTAGHPRLALYRGFSKFMTEDLSQHPNVADLSRKQFKKTVLRVSFEMIKRNDAYSNLVELMFPFHLRLSIHSHNNSGPKFAVRLLKDCLVIRLIEDFRQPETLDLLHVPTPWHNAIVQFDHLDKFYVVKSCHIHEGAERGVGVASWEEKERMFRFKLT